MRSAYRLTFAAAQTITDVICNLTDGWLLHDDGFLFQQAKAWRIGILQARTRQQLTFVKVTIWVYFIFVAGKWINRRLIQELHFGNTDTMLTWNNTIQVACQCHYSRYRSMRILHHAVVIWVDRNISMHVAVTGMHMQGNKYPAF